MEKLPKFYVGQRVVAVMDQINGAFKKGDKFIITGVYPTCCEFVVTIGLMPPINAEPGISLCWICGGDAVDPSMEWPFSECRFAPIHETFQAITFEKVMETELTSVN